MLLYGDYMIIVKVLGRKLIFYVLFFYLVSYWYEKKLWKNVCELCGILIKIYMKVVRRNNYEILFEIYMVFFL